MLIDQVTEVMKDLCFIDYINSFDKLYYKDSLEVLKPNWC